MIKHITFLINTYLYIKIIIFFAWLVVQWTKPYDNTVYRTNNNQLPMRPIKSDTTLVP